MPAKWSKKMSKQKKRPQMTTASSRALKPSRSSDTHLCDTQCSDTQKSPRPSHNTQLHYFLNLPRLGPKHSATEIQWRSLISCLHSWVDEFFCNFSKEMIVLQTWKAGRVCVCVSLLVWVGWREGRGSYHRLQTTTVHMLISFHRKKYLILVAESVVVVFIRTQAAPQSSSANWLTIPMPNVVSKSSN